MLTVCHNSRNDSKKAVIVWYKALNLARNMVSVVWGLQQLVGRLTYWLQLVSCCSFTLNLSTPLPIIIVVIVLRFMPLAVTVRTWSTSLLNIPLSNGSKPLESLVELGVSAYTHCGLTPGLAPTASHQVLNWSLLHLLSCGAYHLAWWMFSPCLENPYFCNRP